MDITQRQWGYYRNLFEVPGVKVKELTVDPGKQLSMQRHFERNEYWLVSEGHGQINTIVDGQIITKDIKLHDEVKIAVTEWHQLVNPTTMPLRIVEIQYGTNCVEEDIERK